MAKKHRVLITGGFGFVGGRVAQRLASDSDFSIVLASRSERKVPDWLNGGTTQQLDWYSESGIADACDSIDTIIHTAGLNAQECTTDPVKAFEINACITARLLKIAAQKTVRRFIYLSTAHVYSSPLSGEIDETTPTRNNHPYAASHLAAENLVLYYAQKAGIDPIILRLSNAFGAPVTSDVQCWHLVANDLCRQASESRRMEIRSSGVQQRDFISMSLVCDSIHLLMTTAHDPQEFAVLNLCSSAAVSIREMASLIQSRCEELFSYSPAIVHGPTENLLDSEILKIHNKKLAALIRLNPIAMEKEIDDLLQFCMKHFG